MKICLQPIITLFKSDHTNQILSRSAYRCHNKDYNSLTTRAWTSQPISKHVTWHNKMKADLLLCEQFLLAKEKQDCLRANKIASELRNFGGNFSPPMKIWIQRAEVKNVLYWPWLTLRSAGLQKNVFPLAYLLDD